jgi:hypothetical protein
VLVRTIDGMVRRIPILLVLLAVVACALVNAGNFGVIDTVRRLQVARWMRLGEPPVTPEDARIGFGLPGRNGIIHAWYGMGQSLFLAPIDAMAEAAVAPIARRAGLNSLRRKQVVELTDAFLMQAVLTACALLLAYRILCHFEFGPTRSVAGVLGLLFATTCLQYIQCAQENHLLLTLALAALAAICAWHRTGAPKWALLAGLACGFAILVRLTSVAEAGLFALFAVTAGSRQKRFLGWFAPPVITALLIDRWYQWYRFGEWFSTYTSLLGRHRPEGFPASYPFSYPFWKGFLGTLFSLDKSIFLFDPLLVVLLVLAIRHRHQLKRSLGLLLGRLALLLLVYIAAFARYYGFGGDVAWGHRFALVPVELLCLFAVPLLLQHRPRALWAVVCVSVILQIGGTVISPNAEVIQRERGYSQGVLWNRAVNLAQIATGREDPQRFAGIPIEWRTVSYFPFQLRMRFPGLASWAIAGWTVLLISLLLLIYVLWSAASWGISPNNERVPSPQR